MWKGWYCLQSGTNHCAKRSSAPYGLHSVLREVHEITCRLLLAWRGSSYLGWSGWGWGRPGLLQRSEIAKLPAGTTPPLHLLGRGKAQGVPAQEGQHPLRSRTVGGFKKTLGVGIPRGSRNRKPRVVINRHPPPFPPPKTPRRDPPKPSPPCVGMYRSAEIWSGKFWGAGWGVLGEGEGGDLWKPGVS